MHARQEYHDCEAIGSPTVDFVLSANVLANMWFTKKPNLAELAPPLSAQEARRRSRILVIDDDQSAFPVELLRAEGYNVEYWNRVKNLGDLESGEYDVIVLDIHGIATPEQSKTGGIGILEHIKRYNPAQLVIAYSSKKYDLNQGAFWRLADDFLGKPSPLTVCKQKLDDVLASRFSVKYYWSVLKELLQKQEVSAKDIQKLENVLVKKFKNKETLSKQDLADIIKLSKESLSAASVIVGLIGKWFLHGQT